MILGALHKFDPRVARNYYLNGVFAMTISEQFTLTQKSGFDVFFNASFKAIEGLERIAALNAQAVKATMTETQSFVEGATSTRDLGEWVALQSAYVQQIPQKMKSYWDHVSTILIETQSQLVGGTESELGKYQADARSFVEGLVGGQFGGQFDAAKATSAWRDAFVATATEAQRTGGEATGKIIENTQEASQNVTDATRQVIVSSDPAKDA